ncbi:hypothetical protein A8135_09395 [Legionella jamestowniensis]|uniref:Beta-lactamase-related domain-containing protein n=1 Tax=Legionella jamestowniensis TaxID=455 RepID=A0ABX2XWE0_9GAMM|nr:hypothetical protein [Legionella jamestowniensis]OCH98962.1 hypothetical protein A8135_09395 [Legionella jamestowniensis]
MIPFNDDSLGLKAWPDSANSTTLAVENQNLFEQYLSDSALPASVSARDVENHSLNIDSEDIYPIHSVAKIFTGITVLSLIEEKPDDMTSIIPEKILHRPIKELLDEEVWQLSPTPLQHPFGN